MVESSERGTCVGEKDTARIDKELLTILQAHPRHSYAQAAAQIGVSAQTVARRYRALHSAGTIRVRGRTLPGFQGRLVQLLSLEAEPEHIQVLGPLLAAERRTRWVRSTSDGTRLLTGLVTSHGDADPILRRLLSIRSVRSWRSYEILHAYTSSNTHAVDDASIVLDDLDRSLLRLLAEDGRMENGALARLLGSSPSTVARRRARLEEHNVLYYETDVDQRYLDFAVDAMLWLAITPGSVQKCADALRARPECRFIAATSGEYAIVANLVVPERRHVVPFLDTHLGGLSIQRYDLMLMGTTYKRSGT